VSESENKQRLATLDFTITRLLQVQEMLSEGALNFHRSPTTSGLYALTLANRRGGLSFGFDAEGRVGWRYYGRVATADDSANFRMFDLDGDIEAFVLEKVDEFIDRLERPPQRR
jgi:hypothetical protein